MQLDVAATHPWLVPFHKVPFHRIPWRGGADYRRDYPEDDEGVHAGTWTFRKVISPSDDTGDCVKAVLRIHSAFFRASRRVETYTLYLELGRATVTVCDARCTSVRDAKAHADRVNMRNALYTLLRRVYNKNRARCVFTADGTPFLSTFDDLTGWRTGLPYGHYYDIDPVEHWNRTRHVHHTELWFGGYCAGTIPAERAAFAATLKAWT